jgi:hypothetical protein
VTIVWVFGLLYVQAVCKLSHATRFSHTRGSLVDREIVQGRGANAKNVETPGKVPLRPVQEHPDSLHKITIGIEHDQLSMRSQHMGRHSVVACALQRGRRGSDDRRGGYNKVTCVHVVTIGIEHDQLTMNKQSTERHSRNSLC